MGYKSKLKQSKRKINECSLTQNQAIVWDRLKVYYEQREKEEEETWQSMKREADAIKSRKYDLTDDYQEARLLLYEALLLGRLHLADKYSIELVGFKSKVKKAGRMLFKSGGMRDMHDGLLWSFIPQSMKRTIDILWDGIGEWHS